METIFEKKKSLTEWVNEIESEKVNRIQKYVNEVTEIIKNKKLKNADEILLLLCPQSQTDTIGEVKNIGDFLSLVIFVNADNLFFSEQQFDLEDIDKALENLDFNDEKTFEFLKKKGIQKEIPYFNKCQTRNVLNSHEPESIDELAIILTINRTGTNDYGKTVYDVMFRQKFYPEKIKYLHPLLEKYLKSTYGLLLFYEQTESILVDIAGFSEEEANKARRSLAKKHKLEIEHYEEIFIKGCLNNSIFDKNCEDMFRPTNEVISDIWDFLWKYAAELYSRKYFTLFAKRAFKIAYLKAHEII